MSLAGRRGSNIPGVLEGQNPTNTSPPRCDGRFPQETKKKKKLCKQR